MPELCFVTVDVFTTTRFRGNPLAIVLVPAAQRGSLTKQHMQTIAKEFNLSETTFLHERSDAGTPEWDFNIFVTTAELPFAGHPTIGTAWYALGTIAGGAENGRLNAAAGPIDLQSDGRVVRASIPHNVHIHEESRLGLNQVIELQPDLQKKHILACDVISPVQDLNFACVELSGLDALKSVRTSGTAPSSVVQLDPGWDEGFVGSYFYVQTDKQGDGVVRMRTRMVEGILEDAATGSAACALSCFLALKLGKSTRFEITQGVEMGRQSEIGVHVLLAATGASVDAVELSGSAVNVMEGKLQYV